MKYNYLMRVVALLLVSCLLLPGFAEVIPEAAAAERITGEFVEKRYTRKGSSGDMFVFDSVQKDCTGFTLYFTLDRFSKGKLSPNANFEVCVQDTSEDWIVAEMFYLQKENIGEQQRISVSLMNPRDICKMAILYRGSGEYSFDYTIRLERDEYDGFYGQTRIEGEFSDKKYNHSNSYTYPFVLEEPLYDCLGFTLHYDLVEVTEGVMDKNTQYEVHVRNTSGKWSSVHKFTMRGDETICDITWKKPKDIDQVAVVAKNDSKFSFKHFFALSDVITEE